MAEENNSQEKTLDPTQKRLDKAKEDGEILSSKEMFVFGSSFMGLIILFCLGMIAKGFLKQLGIFVSMGSPRKFRTVTNRHFYICF